MDNKALNFENLDGFQKNCKKNQKTYGNPVLYLKLRLSEDCGFVAYNYLLTGYNLR